MISEVPPLVCDSAMTDEMVSYMEELPIPGLTPVPDMSASASEDFAAIASKVPSGFMQSLTGGGKFPVGEDNCLTAERDGVFFIGYCKRFVCCVIYFFLLLNFSFAKS